MLVGSSSVPKGSFDVGFASAAEVLPLEALFLDRRGSAKLDPPKLESRFEFDPPLILGCSSFGVARGSEYFGLIEFSKVELALGNAGEKPWLKLNEVPASATVAENVVHTKILRSEA